MTARTKFSCFVAATAFILAAGLAFLGSFDRPTPRVAFRCLGVSSSSNTSFISVGITNQSGSTIVYLVCPPVVKSNGVWNKFEMPLGRPMATLIPGRSATAVITNCSSRDEVKVPILWGFTYSSGATRWQELKEDFLGRFTGRNPGGRGALYTEYLMDIKP